MKIKSKLNIFFLSSALLFHSSLILLRGYFLSIEFTLYPYLTSHGFLPYKNIIDQHFPTLFFGPFSLPSFMTVNPWPLLGIFIFTLLLTDIFLFLSLIRFKVHHPFIWLIFYIVSSVYFSGNILWIETIINLLISLWIFLSFSKSNSIRLFTGIILSQIILLRPTIIPAAIFMSLGLSLPLSASFFIGGLIGFLIPGIYLLYYGLINDFLRLAIVFNGQVYPRGALLLPAKRQIALLILWLAPTIYCLVKKQKTILLLSLVSLLALIYPRFGYEHLQPLFLCASLFLALNLSKNKFLIHLMIVILFFLTILSSFRHSYGNYFLTPNVVKISKIVSSLPGGTIYLLGASDLIYPLSGKIPPNFTYLPSLPWYFSQADFVSRVIISLKDKNTPVLIDYTATVDSYNIVDGSGPIYDFIKMNFTPGQKIDNYQIFYPRK